MKKFRFELIKGLNELGFQKFIATPHILWDIYKNDIETIKPAHAALNAALKENKIDIPVKFAAEYSLDYHIDDLLENENSLINYQG